MIIGQITGRTDRIDLVTGLHRLSSLWCRVVDRHRPCSPWHRGEDRQAWVGHLPDHPDHLIGLPGHPDPRVVEVEKVVVRAGSDIDRVVL